MGSRVIRIESYPTVQELDNLLEEECIPSDCIITKIQKYNRKKLPVTVAVRW